MAAFNPVSGAMQYQVFNSLGLRDLRRVQEQTIGLVLAR